MQCDHKLGLSLGVLIVGFAAALCFPRHRDREVVSLELDEAGDLDHEIALLPVRAYTEQETTSEAPAQPIVPEPESMAFDQPVAGGHEEQLEPYAGPPEPIQAADGASAEPMSRLATASISPDAVAAPEVLEEYTVRAGDTLSGLAARFLGSHARYLELYEANRHLLSSPDDLQPQMRLRIPAMPGAVADASPAVQQAQSSAMAHGEAAASNPSSVVEAEGVDQPQQTRFKPAGRRPFIPAASIPAAPDLDDSAGG